ncbi:MAG: glucose-6-phosphate dehydrogenase, partial [Blastopirellula sp. JB062]
MSHTIVIFGASGDLTSRKLIPALYLLCRKGRLPESTRVVGVSRTEFSHDAWRAELEKTTRQFTGESFEPGVWNEFASQIYYQPGDLQDSDDMDRLAAFLDQLDGGDASRVYYLSTMPKLYPVAVAMIGAAGMADQSVGPRRVVIEKPFGTDLTTAQKLNVDVHKVFAEDHVYRIDHYLGKETVQNLLVMR